jgi:hypothetical protein
MDEVWLRQRAREAIQQGRLPGRRPMRMWGGPGSGGDCRICGKSLKDDEMELELEFSASDGDNPAVHLPCFAAWEFELKSTTEIKGPKPQPG